MEQPQDTPTPKPEVAPIEAPPGAEGAIPLVIWWHPAEQRVLVDPRQFASWTVVRGVLRMAEIEAEFNQNISRAVAAQRQAIAVRQASDLRRNLGL